MVARTRMLAMVLGWVLVLLAASLPFELIEGLALGGLTLTNVEAVALLALGLWAVLLMLERRAPRVPRGLLIGLGVLLAVFVISALLAGAWRGAALKFTARQLQGALIGLCVADQVAAGGWRLARRLGLALLAGASASAACGLLEWSELPIVMRALAVFKEQPTTAGGLLRISATFAYANIAAMYYEAALSLALAGVGLARSRRIQLTLAVCAAGLYLAALLTYSRAALITASAVVALVALGAGVLFRRADGRRRALATCAALGVMLIGLLLLLPTFRVRLAEPDVDRWYRAEYVVAPIAPLAPNQRARTRVVLRNDGLVPWRADSLRPIRLAYHWLDARTRLVVRYNGYRTPLPRPVAPGETIELQATVQAPPHVGQYLIAWDLVSEGSGWFSERGTPTAEVAVVVDGAPAHDQAPAAAEPAGLPQRIEVRPQPPARSRLWGAALQLWRARPLLGIGPDVFRHMYGPALGLASWDDRIHTNNLYIEILVGAGAAGLAAFLGLVALVGWAWLARLRRPQALDARQRRWRWAALGCAAAIVAFLLHGALDMFLEYSATSMLMWTLLAASSTGKDA